MLCKVFSSDININMFPLTGYHVICNNLNLGRGEELLFILGMNSSFQYVIIWVLVITVSLRTVSLR